MPVIAEPFSCGAFHLSVRLRSVALATRGDRGLAGATIDDRQQEKG